MTNTPRLPKDIDTLIIGGGQAGLAMSAHLSRLGTPHLVLERARIAEAWRSRRWDTLVANGPAWHDRFPDMEIAGVGPDEFASKDEMVAYFEAYAAKMEVPLRCGVEVLGVTRSSGPMRFTVTTSDGTMQAQNIVVATGPFQTPLIPPLIPENAGLTQIHSESYRNPAQLDEGAVLVIGAGSSGSQIAEDILKTGRDVYLSIGPHDRPPRSYRGKDFVWWLGVLGKWQMKSPPKGAEHVTIAVSGVGGGRTVDFRRFAGDGMQLLGMTTGFADGVLSVAPDLAQNIAQGDANYLSLLDEADAYVARKGLDLPPEPEARALPPDPACIKGPILRLDLEEAGIKTVIWATGYTQDFGWIDLDAFGLDGKPRHTNGVSTVSGLYFLGLPWLSMRGSAFIWGVWLDAQHLAGQIATAQKTP